MRIPTCLALCAVAVGPMGAVQADYSWELAGSLGQDESELDVESDLSSLSATYYFDAIEDGPGPHALAAFFDPATRVSILANRDERTFPNGALGGETTDYTVTGQYLLPQSKWYFGGRYARGEVDAPIAPPTTASSIDLTTQALVAGKYLSAATRLQLSLSRSKSESDQTVCPFFGCATFNAETTSDDVRFDVMHVRAFRAATYALSGGVSENKTDAIATITFPPSPPATQTFDRGTQHTYFVAAEVFPITKLGVRLGVTRLDGQNLSGDVIDLEASWFFRRNLGLEAMMFREDREGISTEGAALRVIGRF